MALYRKLDPQIWNRCQFRKLSIEGKLIFLYLISHPNQTSLGAFRTSAAGLAAELGMEGIAFDKPFAHAQSLGLVEYDSAANCVFIPGFAKYQSAESPNTIKAWAKQVDWIPECGLKIRAIEAVEAYTKGISQAFHEAFRNAFGDDWRKDYPESVNREQRTGSTSNSPSQEEGIPPNGFKHDAQTNAPSRRFIAVRGRHAA